MKRLPALSVRMRGRGAPGGLSAPLSPGSLRGSEVRLGGRSYHHRLRWISNTIDEALECSWGVFLVHGLERDVVGGITTSVALLFFLLHNEDAVFASALGEQLRLKLREAGHGGSSIALEGRCSRNTAHSGTLLDGIRFRICRKGRAEVGAHQTIESLRDFLLKRMDGSDAHALEVVGHVVLGRELEVFKRTRPSLHRNFQHLRHVPLPLVVQFRKRLYLVPKFGVHVRDDVALVLLQTQDGVDAEAELSGL
mmetsp:Transcript_1022/g.2741  ORF Transcript_1022/g.2741 Transcript_1022/m.2741 type:complete len:252 (-) Transcript_1022:13-768(-)